MFSGSSNGNLAPSGFSLFGNKPDKPEEKNKFFSGNSGPSFAASKASSSNTSFSGKSATLDDSPFGINLSFETVKEMPKSIIGSLNLADVLGDSSSPKAKRLLKKKGSSASINVASGGSQQKYQSNILNAIRNSASSRRANVRHSKGFKSQGLFSQPKDSLQMKLTPDNPVESEFSVALSSHYSTSSFALEGYQNNFQLNLFFGESTVAETSLLAPSEGGDIKQLIIDPAVSAAKRRKLERGILKLNKKEEPSADPKSDGPKRKLEKSIFNPSSQKFQPSQIPEPEIELLEQWSTAHVTVPGYWCSPSVHKLAGLSLSELSSVKDFIVGRKGYGQIAYLAPVDLVALAQLNPKHSVELNLSNSFLNEQVVIFDHKKVNVYPDEIQKPPLGQGINIDAVITLERMFPKGQTSNGPLEVDAINKYLKMLKRQKETEFVNYIADGGIWSFKVPHFSIWGLLDEEESDEEAEQKEEKEEEAQKEAQKEAQQEEKAVTEKAETLKVVDVVMTVPKVEVKAKKGNGIPGGWNFANIDEDEDEDEIIVEDEVVVPAEAVVAVDDRSSKTGDVSDEVVKPDDDEILEDEFVNEKPYEPENVTENDFKILEAHSNVLNQLDDLETSWEATFDSVNQEVSVFNPKLQAQVSQAIPKYPYSKPSVLTAEKVDEIIFKDINNLISRYEQAHSELRLQGRVVAKWEASKLVNSQGKTLRLNKLFGITNLNSEFIRQVFRHHISLSLVVARPNGVPQVTANRELLSDFLSQGFAGSLEGSLWNLVGILFDDSTVLKNPEYREVASLDEGIYKLHLVQISRIQLLQAWLKPSISVPESSDPLDAVFAAVTAGKISTASDVAKQHKNYHLAILLSLLGSNDLAVRFGALRQLDAWRACAQFVPVLVRKIYRLLSGEFLASDVVHGLNWQTVYGLLIAFGDVSKPLPELTRAFFAEYVVPNRVAMTLELSLLELFGCLGTKDPVDQHLCGLARGLNVRYAWYAYELLVRSSGKLTVESAVLGDKLTLEFAEQLVCCGMWEEALFTVLHLSNDAVAETWVTKLVTENIEQVTQCPADHRQIELSENYRFLVEELRIPEKLLASAIGLKYHYLGNFVNEAYALIAAENWTDAHAIMVSKVAPISVIRGGQMLDKLQALIDRFPNQLDQGLMLPEWFKNLGVYKNYVLLLRSLADKEFTLSLVRNLVIHLPLVVRLNQEIDIAVKIMSQYVLTKSAIFERQDMKLQDLPLGEGYQCVS